MWFDTFAKVIIKQTDEITFGFTKNFFCKTNEQKKKHFWFVLFQGVWLTEWNWRNQNVFHSLSYLVIGHKSISYANLNFVIINMILARVAKYEMGLLEDCRPKNGLQLATVGRCWDFDFFFFIELDWCVLGVSLKKKSMVTRSHFRHMENTVASSFL